MSLIDELKKKSKEPGNKNDQAAGTTGQKQALFGPIIQTKLILVQKYFTELSETINQLEPEERHAFNLTHNVVLKGLIQRDFSCYVVKDESHALREVSFKNKLQGNNDFNATCHSSPEAELLKNILTDRNIQFQKKGNGKNNITFAIKPAIYSHFSFSPDLENGAVVLKIINYDGGWDQTLKFRPDKVNEELLDEIGKYALHQENKLMEMTGNRLSMTMRERLQAKLQGKNPMKKKKKVIIKKKKEITTDETKKSSGIMGFFKRQ